MSEETERAIEEIIAYLENMDEDISLRKEPFTERLKCYWDFKSYYKHIWLTGYILITWAWDYNFWNTLNIEFYRDGSYEQ